MSTATDVVIEEISPDAWYAPAQAERLRQWQDFTTRHGAYWSDPRWLTALCRGLGHRPYGFLARREGQIVGVLPLASMNTFLFGRFLVSLPYVNTSGVVSEDSEAASELIGNAQRLADTLDVRYLELRHETEFEHPALTEKLTTKVHMRLELTESSDELWKTFKPKVRNQIRKGEKQEFTVRWGGLDELDNYYAVFSENMRDLGTPVFSRELFRQILEQFPDEAELCTVFDGAKPIAAALLAHGPDMTQVPSASSLKAYNSSNVNMLMYWNLLCRSVERGQRRFDFGRSSEDSSTYRFKKQWGAVPEPAVWQYYPRKGRVTDVRRESGKFGYFIAAWQRLPLWLSRQIGPSIVRGIP
ncbi:MAG: FemAB family PEP-CTERM system-associated protein [Planctomycetota bacterium]|nr:MAG: FemAB family PEP-CTERM system-associated protein [Planctomycetota bacterium]